MSPAHHHTDPTTCRAEQETHQGTKRHVEYAGNGGGPTRRLTPTPTTKGCAPLRAASDSDTSVQTRYHFTQHLTAKPLSSGDSEALRRKSGRFLHTRYMT